MALIKRKRGVRYDNDYNVNVSRHGAMTVVSPNQDYIWVGDDVLDYDSLSPIFHKDCQALESMRNIRRMPTSNALLINGPCAWSLQESGYLSDGPTSSSSGPYTTGANDANSNQGYMHQNLINLRNMDKAERANCGTIQSFNDSGNNAHNTINLYVTTNTEGRQRGFNLLWQGNDLTNPINVSSVNNDIQVNTTLSITGQQVDWGSLIHIDTTNKFMFFQGVTQNSSSSRRASTEFFKVPFTTSPVDGSLLLNRQSISKIDTNTELGNGCYFEGTQMNYAGKNNSGDHCFLTVLESEIISEGSNSNYTDQYSSIKPNKHRIMFTKYNPNTQVATSIADLRGDEGFEGISANTTDVGTGVLARHFPTHFEQSPISGETNIYYAYDVCVEHSNEQISVLRYKWDKANDAFETDVCSLTFPSGQTIKNYLNRVYQPNGSRQDPVQLLSGIQCVLTKSGSSYYLTLFTHNTTPTVVSNLASDSTKSTLVSFAINSSNFTSLSYHSAASFAPLTAVTSNQDCTQMLAIESNQCMVLNWTSSGWTVSATENGIFHAIGKDSSSRIWAVKASTNNVSSLPDDTESILGGGGAGASQRFDYSLHLLSADLPSTATVEFADSDITYSGSNLSKNVLVNAYDSSNNRVAKSVTLKIDGSNAVFASNSSKTLTTTTSTSADTTVGLTITGAGFINISASFTL